MFTCGLALQFLALCYWLIDIKGYRRWSKPFEIFGLNAIALYALADLLANVFDLIKVGGDSLGGQIYSFFGSWLSPINASLAFAITFVLICFFVMWLLYRRRIFIKI
jgi:predicted acyltransferase